MTSFDTIGAMRTTHVAGGYEYLPGLRFASAGVVASSGMAINHALFSRPLALANGLEAVQRILEAAGRPLEALCGLELRLPAALPNAGFQSFNADYAGHLGELGLLRDDRVPFARTNVAPRRSSLTEPAVVACSYTVEADSAPDDRSFVIAGVAELPADATCPEGVIRAGEVTPDALVEKVSWIVKDIETRLQGLDCTWRSSDTTHLYWKNLDLFDIARTVLSDHGVDEPLQGYRWIDSAAPIVGLELEIDVRRYNREYTAQV
jgi:hypothetical protein